MYWFFKIFTHVIQLVTIGACTYYLIKGKSRPYRFLAAGWSLVLLFDLALVITGFFHPVNNHWIYNLFFPLHQLFVCCFFYLVKREKRLLGCMIIFFILATCNLLFLQGSSTLNTFTIAAGGVLIFLAALIAFSRLYKEDTERSLLKEPLFWCCTGFIFYWGFTTPFFSLYNYLWQQVPKFFTFYFFTISFGLTVLLNGSIIKALQCQLRQTK